MGHGDTVAEPIFSDTDVVPETGVWIIGAGESLPVRKVFYECPRLRFDRAVPDRFGPSGTRERQSTQVGSCQPEPEGRSRCVAVGMGQRQVAIVVCSRPAFKSPWYGRFRWAGRLSASPFV